MNLKSFLNKKNLWAFGKQSYAYLNNLAGTERLVSPSKNLAVS